MEDKDDEFSDDNSEDEFEAAKTGGCNIDGTTVCDDPSKLIDIELIQLLSYCKALNEKKSDPDYEMELMMKTIEIGKKVDKKLLIFDMDETLIAAKFADKIPANFVESF